MANKELFEAVKDFLEFLEDYCNEKEVSHDNQMP